jgi:hypothetical protein
MKKPRPALGEAVIWKTNSGIDYNAIVKRVKVRWGIAKIVADKTGINPMPYTYFWVDFDEIGY